MSVTYSVVVILLFGGGLWLMRQQSLAAARAQAVAIATFSSAYTSRMYDLGGEVAAGIADDLSGAPLDAARISPLVAAAAERTAQNDYIVVVDASGDMVAASEGQKRLRAREDALSAHRSGARLFIGSVVRSRLTNAVIYRISRRIEAQDGGFGGYVSVAIRPFGVQPTDRRRPTDPQVSVWSEDGRFIAGTFVDFDAAGAAIAPPRPAGLGTSLPGQVSERDGRMHSESKVEGLPLIVSVDFETDGVLTPWRRAAPIAAAVGAVLLMLGAGLAWTGVRAATREKAARLALETAQAETEASLLGREMLLREIHHRVRNSLMLVSSFLMLQARGADAATRAALARVQTQVTSIGMVHETLYAGSDLGLIDLDEYLGRLLPELGAGLGVTDRGITLSCRVTDVTVPSDQATTIGLIVSEAVTNAVKYAFDDGGQITVIARSLNDRQVELLIADDGRGMDGRGGEGLGSHLLGSMARQLGGRSTVQGESGTTVRVVFPRRQV